LDNQKKLALQKEALKKASMYQRLFNSEEGQTVLKDLREAFDGPPLTSELPHYTHVRAGELNVLRYIDDVLQLDVMEVDPNE